MVVREDPDSAAALCIPQSQHAAVAGQMAAAWGNETFPVPEPRAEVLEAATRHDDGMDDFDAEPEIDPETGLPRDFMRMPLPVWLECWRRGPALVAEDSPYAGILVSLHGTGLLGYRRLDDPEEARIAADWVSEQEELREECAGDAERQPDVAPGLGGGALERNRALIWAWDAMSLGVCVPRLPDAYDDVPSAEGSVRIEFEEISERREGDPFTGVRTIAVDPWPFAADAVELEAQGRILDGRFEDRAAMQEALAGAEVRSLKAILVGR